MESIVDVIIPAYNSHATIVKTLDSVAKQTNREVINVCIIDDCSNVSYEKECERYKGILKIELLKLDKNSGPGAARQYGILHTNSKYIMFLDSDDIFTDDTAVEDMVKCIDKNGFDAASGMLTEDIYGETSTYYAGYDTLHAKIYRRSFLEEKKIHFPANYNSEDLAFNNFVILNTANLGQIDTNVYTYQRRRNSLTQTEDYYSDKHIKCLVENLKYVLNKAEENGVDKAFISNLIYSNFNYFMYYFSNDTSDPSFKYILELIPYYEKYQKYYIEGVGSIWLRFWINRNMETGEDQFFDEFMLKCKQEYNALKDK